MVDTQIHWIAIQNTTKHMRGLRTCWMCQVTYPCCNLFLWCTFPPKKIPEKKNGGNDSHLRKANIPCSNSTIKNRSGWMMIFHQLPPIPCLSNFTVWFPFLVFTIDVSSLSFTQICHKMHKTPFPKHKSKLPSRRELTRYPTQMGPFRSQKSSTQVRCRPFSRGICDPFY